MNDATQKNRTTIATKGTKIVTFECAKGNDNHDKGNGNCYFQKNDTTRKREQQLLLSNERHDSQKGTTVVTFKWMKLPTKETTIATKGMEVIMFKWTILPCKGER